MAEGDNTPPQGVNLQDLQKQVDDIHERLSRVELMQQVSALNERMVKLESRVDSTPPENHPPTKNVTSLPERDAKT